jgi:hypothetical protein
VNTTTRNAVIFTVLYSLLVLSWIGYAMVASA